MTGHAYCTYFDSAYAPRGRVLVESLRANGDEGTVHVLAADDDAHRMVSSWTDLNVSVVSLPELQATYPQLAAARETRSRMEYLFTLTPWLTRWTLERVPADSWATYLDADMAFFSSTVPVYSAIEGASVAIVEHRFTWEQAWRLKYGRFNVAWVGFRNDTRGRACVDWWADRCLEWCRDEVSEGRFADQGYLDRFPEFPGVAVIDHPGVDVAPWNLRRHRIAVDDAGGVTADGEPLVFFHFHGLRKSGTRYFFKHLPYLAPTSPTIRDDVYRPYCEALEAAEGAVGLALPPAMARRPTLAAALRSGSAGTLQWLGERRGDYLDLPES